MKLLIYEYYSSGMGGRCGLVNDGFAMVDALLRDFALIPGLEISTVLDGDMPLPDFPSENLTVYRDLSFRDALEACDCVLPVAPETDGILARLTEMAESRGKRVIGSSAAAVALAGNKAPVMRLLEENGLPTPRWEVLEQGFPCRRKASAEGDEAPFSFPFVIKPVQGAGGEGVRIIRTGGQWESWRGSLGNIEENAFMVQEVVQGEAVSVSMLARGREVTPLSLNRQHIGFEAAPDGGRQPVFLGITVPYGHQWADTAMDMAVKACSLVPGLKGFVGVDLMMGDKGPVVLEINPRVTFAYIALRRVVSQNLAQELLDICCKDRRPRKPELLGSYTCIIRNEESRN